MSGLPAIPTTRVPWIGDLAVDRANRSASRGDDYSLTRRRVTDVVQAGIGHEAAVTPTNTTKVII